MESLVTMPAHREALNDLLRWRRIGNGLRYWRRHGLRAVLRRLLPGLRDYQAWIAEYDQLGRGDIETIRQQVAAMAEPPVISVLLAVPAGQEAPAVRSAASLAAQLYPHWNLRFTMEPRADAARLRAVLGDERVTVGKTSEAGFAAAPTNATHTDAAAEFVMRLDPGDEIAPHTLYLVAIEIANHPRVALIYSDEDSLDSRRRRQTPRFKCDWNPQLLLGCDAIGRLALYRRDIIERVGGFRPEFDGAADYDLALRASEVLVPEQVRHLPYVLYHRQAAPRGPDIAEAERRALSEHFARTGETGVEVLPGLTGETHRIVRPLPTRPSLVSLIVPVGASLPLVRNCLSGLLEQTDYVDIELLLMVNNGTKTEVLPYLEKIAADPRVSLVDTCLNFNFSRICNLGVERARGDVIGLINDDLQVIDPGWLREMVSHAVRPEVGAVGAKLYYPDDTIQHAGVIMAPGGGASHWFRHAPRNDAGYCNRLLIAQNLSVVTAACLLLRKAVYEEVGGLDEVNFAVAFNDVDLCLKIRDNGYLVVWTPFAELYHMESASRGSDYAPERIERFRREVAVLLEKWSITDPYFSPNLALYNERPGLAFPPRIARPWRTADQCENPAAPRAQ